MTFKLRVKNWILELLHLTINIFFSVFGATMFLLFIFGVAVLMLSAVVYVYCITIGEAYHINSQ
jgi:uncharacterized membrane protein